MALLRSTPSTTSASSNSTAADGLDIELLQAVLCEIGRVERLEELGAHGPLLASGGRDSLFHCLFGRDALRMARDLLDDFPAVARTTLLELAHLQGVQENPRGEEEPGRILHEHRYPGDRIGDELRKFWDFPYYGAIDTTPNWINLLSDYVRRLGSARFLHEEKVNGRWQSVTLRESLRAAVEWLLRRLDDPRGSGFLWVQRASPSGIPNQVWEDSPDSYYYEDGALLDPTVPYAPVAPQGYAYDALLAAADLLEEAHGAMPAGYSPGELRERAATLREQTLAVLWQPDLGTFAQAVSLYPDGRSRVARVVSSSPGHLLDTSLLDGADLAHQRDVLAARMLAPDLVAGAGIRSKSLGAARFRAGSYHNGSTWPMDTGWIADGLRRHGLEDGADALEERILAGCAAVGSYPEFFRGDADGQIRVNVETIDEVDDLGVVRRIEQQPQANQGWTATRVWRILRRRGLISLEGVREVTPDTESHPKGAARRISPVPLTITPKQRDPSLR